MLGKAFRVFTQYSGLSRSIYIIFIARVVTSMGAFIWPMLTFIMAGKMGYDEFTIGIISAATGLLFLPASIVGGKLADKFNKKKIIIIFDTISVAFFVTCAFLEPGIPMLVFFSLAGLFANMEWPAFDALIIEASKPAEREKVFSMTYLGMNLGLVFGAAMGGFLYENYLNLAFALDGLTTISSTLLIVLFVKTIKVSEMEEHEINEYENEEEDHVSTWKILWQRKAVFLMIFVVSISSFVYEQWSFSLPLYLNHIFGDDAGSKLYGTMVSFNGAIVIIFTPILTAALVKWRELQKIFVGIALFSLTYWMILNSPAVEVFFIMIFMFTIGEIVNTIGNSPYMSRRIPASHRGRVSSYMGIGHMIGGTMGRLITGFTNQYLGYNFTFTMVGILGIICISLVALNFGLDRRIFPKLYVNSTENIEAVDQNS